MTGTMRGPFAWLAAPGHRGCPATEEMMSAFITGSHAYGTPTKESDLDIVILCDESVLDDLADRIEDVTSYGTGNVRVQVTGACGRIDLIMVSHERFDVWRRVTDELIARKPVSRDEAKRAFAEAFSEFESDDEVAL